MLSDFKNEFGNIAPIGYVLRNSINSCIRIHNFSDRRYPENNDDREDILKLYQYLADKLCHYTLETYISFYDFDKNELENVWLSSLNLKFLDKYNINPKEDEPYFVKTYLCSIDKNSNEFKRMILDVADEEFDGNITFQCNYNNNIILISPYPGGVDIFTKNKSAINNIKHQLKTRNLYITECPK